MSAYYYHSREQDPSTLHNLNGFRDIRQTEEPELAEFYDPPASFRSSYFVVDPPLGMTDYGGHFNDYNDAQELSTDLRTDTEMSLSVTRGSLGTAYHTHSINDGLSSAPHWPFNGDLSLRTLDLGGGEGKFLPQAEVRTHELRSVYQGGYHGVSAEGAYQPSYHAVNSPSGYSRSKPAALPPRTKSPPRQPTNLMRDFVHMNEAYITTDLPEETPFGLVPTDARAPSFQNHPYPDGHRWPQTFKITEVKQIGPKKQTLACFFCRSRKIACAPRPVDGTEDRSCEQCERRKLDCKYPKESKRGQHNRRSSNA